MDMVTLFAACGLWFAGGSGCNTNPAPLLATDSRPHIAETAPARSNSLIDRWQSYIHEASRLFAIPEAWIRAVMQQESGGRTILHGRPITSDAGAMGLMQIMPGTYSDLRKQYGFGPNSYDPHDNILAGAAYLRQMYDRYGYPSLFAAYNAGPKRFEAFASGSKTLPGATLNYVESILPGVGTTFDRVPVAGPIAPGKPQQRALKGPIHDAQRSLFFVRSESENHAKTDSDSANLTTNLRSIFVSSSGQDQAPHSDSRSEIFVPLTPSAATTHPK